MLEYKNVSYQIADRQILESIDFKLEAGKITAILGSNGSGKSSLIKLLLKNKREYSGEIAISGKPFIKTSDVSILMQSTVIPDHFTVYDFMKYSLIGSRSILSKITDKDNSQIDSCLEKCDSLQFKDKLISNLSGGERQRIIISSALLNNPKILILDEPTTFLDIKYQTIILNLIKELNEKEQMTILIVIHDLNHGLRLADNVILLKQGKIIENKSATKISEDDLKLAFDIEFNRHGKNTFITNI